MENIHFLTNNEDDKFEQLFDIYNNLYLKFNKKIKPTHIKEILKNESILNHVIHEIKNKPLHEVLLNTFHKFKLLAITRRA